MASSHLFGALLALTSALLSGSGDFSGGLASRRNDQFQVLVLAASSSTFFLAAFALVRGESLPSLGSSLWAASAGVSGVLGLAALYRALSLGNAAIVSPIAGVAGAVLPAAFAAFTEGLPHPAQLVGFITAMVGIWLVTRSPSASEPTSQESLLLAILAGVAFGGFFILIAQVESGTVFVPLAIAKVTSICVALLTLLFRRMQVPSPRGNPIALLAGMLDAGANTSYLLAERLTRLDVAAMLASLYPAATVLLACVLLNERISRVQWIGVALCLTATALIVL
jgi:drug/metabolite transporter (DMT)-like permease